MLNAVPNPVLDEARHESVDAAVKALDEGEVTTLERLLAENPGLAEETDEGNATLLVRLIDYPGQRPNAAESARILIEAGTPIDARRDDENGTALAGAVCTNDVDVVQVLIEKGANINAVCGWRDGTVIEFVDELCEGLHLDQAARSLQEQFSTAAGRPVPQRPRVGMPVPLLFVSDFKESLKYYTEKVGFRLAWLLENDWETPYASITRGDADFHITGCHCEDKGHVGKLDARLETRELDSLFADMQAAGVMINFEPKDQPWGLREFEIGDPDGNKLTFFQH